jgi:single-stranded DNA-specific DHH superfamily exonuclease
VRGAAHQVRRPQAGGGLTIESARIREFRSRINDHADERLGPDDLRPALWLDGPLPFRGITAQVAEELATLAPFGAGNRRRSSPRRASRSWTARGA